MASSPKKSSKIQVIDTIITTQDKCELSVTTFGKIKTATAAIIMIQGHR